MPKTKKLKPAKTTTETDGTVKAWYRIADLTLDPQNARGHDKRNIDAIAASLKQFGQQKNIVIGANGVVQAGNGTCLALLQNKEELVWGVQSKLLGSSGTAYGLADNRSAELAHWEWEIVQDSLQRLKDAGEDITGLGWEDYELEPLLKGVFDPPKIKDDDAEDVAFQAHARHSVTFDLAQFEIIQIAINKLRKREKNPELSESDAIEQISREWSKR